MGKNEAVGESPPGEERYRANPDFVLREIAGEAILVPTGETAQKLNGMVNLTETGTVLWKHLEKKPQTVNNLSTLLADTYNIGFEMARSDVKAYVEKALTYNLLILS